MVYLLALVALGAVGILRPLSFLQWASCTFFFQNYLGEFPGRLPYTGHFWSLAVEEHFYLILPAMLFLLGSVRLRRIVPVVLWPSARLTSTTRPPQPCTRSPPTTCSIV